MSISELRDEFRGRLVSFLWDQWGQMGVSANANHHDIRAADPEALLVLTFEVGREEPRLFDEVLDWMLVNERLISVQRLRNLAEDEDDRALVEAVLGWLGQNRRRARLGARSNSEASTEPQPFFRGLRLKVTDPDPAFHAQGFLKPVTERSGKSQAPDLSLPINFAFRLRLLLGIGVRAEVMRILLTVTAPWVNAQTLAGMTAYTKRNVQEAASALSATGEATAQSVSNENRFAAPRERWARFLELEPEDLPRHENWPQLFRIWRAVLRWLGDPAIEDLSDYMLASELQTLLESVESDLLLSGFPLDLGDPTRDLSGLDDFVRGLTKGLV